MTALFRKILYTTVVGKARTKLRKKFEPPRFRPTRLGDRLCAVSGKKKLLVF